MGLGDELKKQAMALSQKAMEKLLADEKRAMRVAEVMGRVQRGRQALVKGQDGVLRALSFAPKSDFKVIGKQLSALKRRIRELDEKLARLSS